MPTLRLYVVGRLPRVLCTLAMTMFFSGCLKVVGFVVCKDQPTTEDINGVGKSQPTAEYSTFKQPEKIIKKIKNNSLKNQ